MTNSTDRVADWLKDNRQWRRQENEAHAKFKIATIQDDEKAFWEAILKAVKP